MVQLPSEKEKTVFHYYTRHLFLGERVFPKLNDVYDAPEHRGWDTYVQYLITGGRSAVSVEPGGGGERAATGRGGRCSCGKLTIPFQWRPRAVTLSFELRAFALGLSVCHPSLRPREEEQDWEPLAEPRIARADG